jgi:mannose-6-phosphate isomerase-like protein (cupin superfamily)
MRKLAGLEDQALALGKQHRQMGNNMVTVIDLKAELGKLTTLRNRTPQTTRAERAGTSAQLGEYRDGGIFTSKFAGKGAWERHPHGDELVQILDGAATLDIVTDDGPQSIAVSAGMLAVVPRGAWHRFQSPDGVTVMTATPQPSEHVRADVDDPRTIEPTQG